MNSICQNMSNMLPPSNIFFVKNSDFLTPFFHVKLNLQLKISLQIFWYRALFLNLHWTMKRPEKKPHEIPLVLRSIACILPIPHINLTHMWTRDIVVELLLPKVCKKAKQSVPVSFLITCHGKKKPRNHPTPTRSNSELGQLVFVFMASEPFLLQIMWFNEGLPKVCNHMSFGLPPLKTCSGYWVFTSN